MAEKLQHKNFVPQVKQVGDAGSFEAVIATMGVVDSDGDVIERGAFNGATAPILPAHNQGSVPLGKARVEERDDKAVAVGQLNLEVAAARDWHSHLKFDLANPPAQQEWSWGFIPTKFEFEEREDEQIRLLKELDLLEVSPVLRGASVGTMTLDAKSLDKRATGAHESATSTATWDGAAARGRLPSPVPVSSGRRAFAWVDQESVEDGEMPKSAGRFIHHFVDSSGSVGAASTRACITGIAVLNGARGGTTIPDSDRRGVWDHLAGHLRDADIEPPELRESTENGGVKLTLHEELALAAWDVDALAERVRCQSAMRQKNGRKISDDTALSSVELGNAIRELAASAERMDAVVRHIEKDREPNQVERQIGAYLAHKARFG